MECNWNTDSGSYWSNRCGAREPTRTRQVLRPAGPTLVTLHSLR